MANHRPYTEREKVLDQCLSDGVGYTCKQLMAYCNAKAEELDEKSTCARIAQVRQEGSRTITRNIPFYNLDMIISVGYRVNSKSATIFRRWATNILRNYLVKGYAINNSIASKKYEELCQLVQILGRTASAQPELTSDESHELIKVVSDYTYALDTLDRYNYQQLTIEKTTQKESFHATYNNAMEAIMQLKEKFGESRWYSGSFKFNKM